MENRGIEIIISTVSGEQLTNFTVEPDQTAWDVKRAVFEQFGYMRDSQQLVQQGAGVIIEDDGLLASFPQPVSLTLVLLPFNKQEALFAAVFGGREAAVRALLFRVARNGQERREMLMGADLRGFTALRLAAWHGDLSICRVLLEATQDLTGRSEMLLATVGFSHTALHFAAENGHDLVCRMLLEAAPTPEVLTMMLAAAESETGSTALHLAAWNGHEMVCQALLEAAPNIKVRSDLLAARDWEGSTALHVATMEGFKAICEVLLGAAPSSEERAGMLLAGTSGDKQMFVDAYQCYQMVVAGSTALHMAAVASRETICQVLLLSAPNSEVRRAMLAARNDEGRTASQMAYTSCQPILESA